MRPRLGSWARPTVAVVTLLALATPAPGPADPVVIQLYSWNGNASPLPICLETPLDEPGHVFSLPNFGTGTLRVHADWQEVPSFLDDLNMFVDRLVGGVWTSVGGDVENAYPDEYEDSHATVELIDPSPGQYRVRIVNCISVVTAYDAEATFTTTG